MGSRYREMNKSTLAISMFRSTFKYSDTTLPLVNLNDNHPRPLLSVAVLVSRPFTLGQFHERG
jgi:hypothetical protein